MEEQYSVGNFVYDPKVYDGLNTQKEDIDFYKQWINDNKIKKVLELCCGTGRITIPLAKSGINISGLDLNNQMLAEAKDKSLKEEIDISFINGDMRNFKLDTQYQLIFIPFNSIHCLYKSSDLVKTLKCVYDHLDNNAFLIIDYFNPNIEYISNNQNKSVLVADYATEDGRKIQIHQSMSYDDNTQVNRIMWEHTVNNEFHSKESLDMRMYYPQELDFIITNSNFTIINKYGNYSKAYFSKGSPIQLIICQKE